jgi:iron complex transport system ATP-binding protein
MTACMEIQNARYRYAEMDTEPVFEGVSFTISSSEVFCLLGPNGSGKSTLLKCLAGLLSVERGTVLLGDRDIGALSAVERARVVGFVPQSLTPAFPFQVRDVVVMGRASRLNLFAAPAERDYAAAQNAMDRIGIRHLARRSCNRISGGEWQLVLIARALAQNPSVLLLDEPTSHLDLGNQMKILRVVNQLSTEGLAIVMASHFPDHAFLCGDRVALLKDHAFMRIGTPDEVVTAASMEAAYGVTVAVLPMGNGVARKVCVPMLGKDTDSGTGAQSPKNGGPSEG